jgi:putative heme-binding domain-containing protein
MLHQMPGAYYVKGFSKHGPLHNPHTYGYFDHVPYKGFQGGHVTCGGVVYEADAYPPEYRGQYIAANLLSNCINWHKLTPKGSSFTAEHGGSLLQTSDQHFRPIDCLLGPDGCIYVVDWTDKRAAHLDPIDNWDKTNGRIYKIEYQDAKPLKPFDLGKQTSQELMELLKHPNLWWRKEARRLLAERGDVSILPALRKLSQSEPGLLALEALWAIHGLGKFRLQDLDNSDTRLLKHPNEHVRAWVARLLGDAPVVGQLNESDLIEMAKTETSPVVLAQLACTAMRISDGPNLVTKIVARPASENDPHIPLLCWWALERTAISQPSNAIKYLRSPSDWGPVMQSTILERLARRWMAEKSEVGYKYAGELLQASWFHPERAIVLRGIESGMAGGLTAKELAAFNIGLIREGRREDLEKLPEPDRSRILAKFGDEAALKSYLEQVQDAKRPDSSRIAAIQLLASLNYPPLEASLLQQLESGSDALRLASVAALARSTTENLGSKFLGQYAKASPALQKQILQVLLSRPKWALTLFQSFESGQFPKTALTLDHAKIAAALDDKALTSLVEKHFGKIAPTTPGEMQARIAALNLMLSREKPGDPTLGKPIFAKHCAACHQLHGEGTKIGPDLTTADRKNRTYLLSNIVNPSGYIRPEFMNFSVNTLDGRALTGLVSEQKTDTVALATYVNGKIEQTVIAKKDIDSMKPSALSLMPEKLLDSLTNDEIRHLFAYITSDPDPRPAGGAGPKKLRVALVSGSVEYKSDESLPKLQKLLEEKYPVECVRIFRKTDSELPDAKKLAECDAAIFFTRRLTIDGEELAAVKAFVESGKPILGIRTASHGFQKWLEMDALVFGGDYKNHFGAGPKCEVQFTEAGKTHPVLKNVKPFKSVGSLYKNPNIAKDVIVLQNGTAAGKTEPVTWVRERKVGEKTQRIFYTSLGHQDDFLEDQFLKMLVNALGWCAKNEAIAAK